MKVLELFSGTEHVSREFRKRGHETFTIDWNMRFNSSAHCDIQYLSAEQIISRFGKPDVIFAAFDCTTFSVAAIGFHRKLNKETGNLDPKTPYAAKCDKIDQHCLKLIYDLKPKVFIIENPRAGLRSMKWMQGIPRTTTTYCQYGFSYMKPTDFWSNVDLHLKAPCKNGDTCHEKAPRGTKLGLQAIKDRAMRSIYPPLLISHLVDECERYYADENVYPIPECMNIEEEPFEPRPMISCPTLFNMDEI